MKKPNQSDNGTVSEHLGVVIDYSRDNSLPEQGKAMLTRKGFYKKEWENSPQETLARAATCYSFGDYEFAQRIYDYSSKGYFTFASPVLSNAIEINWPSFSEKEFHNAAEWLEENATPEGQPISCFLTKIEDSKQSLVETRKEVSWLSMMGGGIGIHTSNRSPDEKSTGVMAHLRGYDADTLAYKQGNTRRGSMAAYIDIDHPEIIQFLEMRNPTGGDSNKKCFNLNHAVNITDSFMAALIMGGPETEYELIDPKHGPTGQFLNVKETFEKIMELRYETGEPYIMFKDTVNRNLPDWITRPLYEVSQSNLCVAPETEILTDIGYVTISVVAGEYVNVWNGFEWSNVQIKKTGEKQKLLKVVTDSGKVLECTPYHKFYVFQGHGKPYVEKRAHELVSGDKLMKYELAPNATEEDVKDFDRFIEVSEVLDEDRYDDTYCFEEPKRHLGMFNGILTGQCSEITLMTSDKRTAVCCLSSLNLEKIDGWKDLTIVEDLVRLLDNVLEYFIRLAPEPLKKAVHSASKERSIGIGTLGWHSYLQRNMIPFEGGGIGSAIQETSKIYKMIKKRSKKESLRLGTLRGEAPDCRGTGMRNAHLMSIAPNASSASLVGASPSIEPWNSNAFNAQGRAGSFLIKNKYLEKVLEKYGKNTKEVWKDIITNEGSVQHLTFLSDLEKKVFKTAFEIDPMWVIEQGAVRQKHVCQSQSLNIFVNTTITMPEMSHIHISAWLKGIKTLYYCRSKAPNRAKIGDGKSAPLNAVEINTGSECVACEG